MDWLDRPSWGIDLALVVLGVTLTINFNPTAGSVSWVFLIIRLIKRGYRWFCMARYRRNRDNEERRRLGFEPNSNEILIETDTKLHFEVSECLHPFPRSSRVAIGFDGSQTREQLYRFEKSVTASIENTHEERVELLEFWVLVTRTTEHANPLHVRLLHGMEVLEWLNRCEHYSDERELRAEWERRRVQRMGRMMPPSGDDRERG